MDRKTAFALVIGLLTATGAWLLRISTPFGLGLTDDAISYIAASRALLAGQGFTRIWLASGLEPITHWPPAFSATLTALSLLLKIDSYRSARFLNILVFGANAGILALLGYKITDSNVSARSTHLRRGSLAAGIFLSFLFLSNTAFLHLHAQALSEPLYLLVSLLAFLAFYRAFEFITYPSTSQREGTGPLSIRERAEGEGRGHRYLILAGLLTGLSYLTRYAALSLLATFIVAIFILRPTWRKRFSSLAFFLVGALPVMLTWMLRNKFVAGSATNRAIQWHPITTENITRGLKAFFQFIIPLPELFSPFLEKPFILAIIPSFITLALLFWIIPRGLKRFLKPEENAQPEILPFITALYIFSYMGSLLVSLTLFDAATPLNDRILSSVYLAVLIMLVYFIHKLFQQGKIRSRFLAIGFALFFLSTSLIAQVRTVDELQKSAMGFASWRWGESVVTEAIRELPEETAVYTNQPPAVYFWTDRSPYRLWDEQPEDIRSGDAVLAIFFPPEYESPAFQAWFTVMTEGLEPIQKSGLGNLYQKTE